MSAHAGHEFVSARFLYGRGTYKSACALIPLHIVEITVNNYECIMQREA